MTDAKPTNDHQPVDDEQDSQPKEGLDLRPDGGVHLWLDGRKIRLRRPRGREFRRIREELQDGLDEINAENEKHAAWLDAVDAHGDERKAAGEPTMTPEERAENIRRGREIRDFTENVLVRWWVVVVETLAVEGTTLEAEDLPIWLADQGEAVRMLDHWRAVPSLSGVR